MEPIISPWLFYWIGRSEALLIFLIFVVVLGGITLGMFTILYYQDNYELLPHFRKYLAFWCLFLFLSIAIPTPDTIYKMIIAQNITYERVSKAGDIGKELHKTLKQDVLDIIKELTRGKEKK